MFRMDSNLVPYMTMLAVAWGLCGAGVVFVAPLIQWRITNRESAHSCFSIAAYHESY